MEIYTMLGVEIMAKSQHNPVMPLLMTFVLFASLIVKKLFVWVGLVEYMTN